MNAAYWEEQLIKYQEIVSGGFELLNKVIASPEKYFEFDSGDGRVSARVWTPKEVMDMIERAQSTADWIERRLSGAGIVITRLRR